jgi:hypothetical protein
MTRAKAPLQQRTDFASAVSFDGSDRTFFFRTCQAKRQNRLFEYRVVTPLTALSCRPRHSRLKNGVASLAYGGPSIPESQNFNTKAAVYWMPASGHDGQIRFEVIRSRVQEA